MRALIFFSEKKDVSQFVKYLEEELFLMQVETVLIPVKIPEPAGLEIEIRPETDFAVSLGGDGTVLFVTRTLYPHPIPIFPVNFGNLGFITEIKRNELIPMIQKYIKGQASLEERILLDGQVVSSKEITARALAFNDMVITRHALCKLIELELSIDGEYVCRYKADGLILSTPTGSTAYSLSASGPILEPGLNCFLITPICPHSLRVRPLVVPAEKTLEVRILSSETQMLAVDGQEWHPLNPGDMVRVAAAEKKTRIVKPDLRNFYMVLKEKLNWLE